MMGKETDGNLAVVAAEMNECVGAVACMVARDGRMHAGGVAFNKAGTKNKKQNRILICRLRSPQGEKENTAVKSYSY